MKKPISRREFLLRSLQLSTIPMIGGISPLVMAELLDPNAELLADEKSIIRQMFNWPNNENFEFFPVGLPKGREAYSKVVEKLHPLFLDRVDYLLMINTSMVTPNNSRLALPAQQLVILKKGSLDGVDNLFPANPGRPSKAPGNQPTIISFPQQAGNVLWQEVQRYNVSTGSSSHLQTFSGIFRINEKRSRSNFNSSPQAGMSHQLYIDFVYDTSDSRESGVAIHGTPSSNHGSLGLQPKSHGCARIHPDDAKVLRAAFFGTNGTNGSIGRVDDLPQVDRKDRFATPLFNVENGEVKTLPGCNALIVFFNEYDGSSASV